MKIPSPAHPELVEGRAQQQPEAHVAEDSLPVPLTMHVRLQGKALRRVFLSQVVRCRQVAPAPRGKNIAKISNISISTSPDIPGLHRCRNGNGNRGDGNDKAVEDPPADVPRRLENRPEIFNGRREGKAQRIDIARRFERREQHQYQLGQVFRMDFHNESSGYLASPFSERQGGEKP